MLEIKHHFLDTNMILTIPLKGDSYRDCVNYYKLNYERHISYNVQKEVFNVIERLRLITTNIFNHMKNYILSKNIPLTKIDQHIHNIKKSYINKFTDEDYVFNIEKEKFLAIVDDVFITYYDEIKDTILNNDNNLDILLLKSRRIFKIYNKAIINCIGNFNIHSFENNDDLINQLIKIGIHENDAILVDDCYNISKDLNEEFVFVTQDNGIIQYYKDVFKLLNSKIHFSKPNAFLNN